MPLRLYLAGPDVFRPQPAAYGEALKALCAASVGEFMLVPLMQRCQEFLHETDAAATSALNAAREREIMNADTDPTIRLGQSVTKELFAEWREKFEDERRVIREKREKAEKAQMAERHEDKQKQHGYDTDNLRKRKDKYKALYMESSAKGEASKTIVASLQGDREAYLSTLKAQQQVVAEQASASLRMATDRKDAEHKTQAVERKLAQQTEESANVSEALREYQSAAAEWMYENHAMGRELNRVTKSYNDLRGVADPAIAGSPRAMSPSASPHRSVLRGQASPGSPRALSSQYSDPVNPGSPRVVRPASNARAFSPYR